MPFDGLPDPLRCGSAARFFRVRRPVIACAFYFWARLAHAVVYTLGAPVLRTLAFTVGFAAQVVLVLAIFRLV
jgi:uncharacterized MAPEG superfamily protein